MSGENKPLLRALAGEPLGRPAWWLMRQAGRYLPEYRDLRARTRDFIDLCLTPSLAAEATLQPLRRFGMDAAIVFADILLVPHVLGQPVEYRDDGPALAPLDQREWGSLLRVDGLGALDAVGETVQRMREALPGEVAVIGFAGAPWTVATYMAEGGATRDFRRTKLWAYRDPDGFSRLIGLITEATAAYLARQIAAGADAVQLFDSWAGVLPETEFARWVIEPTRAITARLKERFPTVPIIGFPRAAGLLYERYAVEAGVDAIGLDTMVPLGFAQDRLQSRMAVQGNLDPAALLAGGPALERQAAAIRRALEGGPFVFNLGHGVLPQTPPEHVTALARLLREPLAG
jgi:uroporphyrinogen decarboxylase